MEARRPANRPAIASSQEGRTSRESGAHHPHHGPGNDQDGSKGGHQDDKAAPRRLTTWPLTQLLGTDSSCPHFPLRNRGDPLDGRSISTRDTHLAGSLTGGEDDDRHRRNQRRSGDHRQRSPASHASHHRTVLRQGATVTKPMNSRAQWRAELMIGPPSSPPRTPCRLSVACEDVADQPIVRSGDGHVKGSRRCLRWSHPDRGAFSPITMVHVVASAPPGRQRRPRSLGLGG